MAGILFIGYTYAPCNYPSFDCDCLFRSIYPETKAGVNTTNTIFIGQLSIMNNCPHRYFDKAFKKCALSNTKGKRDREKKTPRAGSAVEDRNIPSPRRGASGGWRLRILFLFSFRCRWPGAGLAALASIRHHHSHNSVPNDAPKARACSAVSPQSDAPTARAHRTSVSEWRRKSIRQALTVNIGTIGRGKAVLRDRDPRSRAGRRWCPAKQYRGLPPP